MRVQIYKDPGVDDAVVTSLLEETLTAIGPHDVVDRLPDYFVVMSSGCDCKCGPATTSAEVGLTGEAADLWDKSEASIRHSFAAVGAVAAPRNIRMKAPLTGIDVFAGGVTATVTPADAVATSTTIEVPVDAAAADAAAPGAKKK